MSANKCNFTFPICFEATHVDSGFHTFVKIDNDGYCFGKLCELLCANSLKEMKEELMCLEFMHGEAWIFEPVPIDAIG